MPGLLGPRNLQMATYRTATSVSQHFQEPVMWSETVGLRTRPVWDHKIGLGLAHCGLGLAGLALFCEKQSCHARRHNDLEGHSNFSSSG